ncbi:MAG: acyl-ACP--UDP-N-acetylglucosamine O-acyltransferase [Verrucomicrobiota bacterium]
MTETYLHPTALIDPQARLGAGRAGRRVCRHRRGGRARRRLPRGHHATIEGPSKIGPRNEFFPYAAIGFKTQDLKYRGEPTHLEIGEGNVFREFTTVHRGTGPGEKTVIGDGNLFLAYAHVAHNCVVGSKTIFSNNATLAGHVTVGDHAVISGLAAVHQFCRIGAHAIIGGCAKIVQDVPPFLIADGNPANLRGVNHVGLERRGFAESDIKALRRAYRILADKTLNFSQAIARSTPARTPPMPTSRSSSSSSRPPSAASSAPSRSPAAEAEDLARRTAGDAEGGDAVKYICRADDPERTIHYGRYLEYLETVRGLLPPDVHAFAADERYFSLDSPHTLHDSWLDSVEVRESRRRKDRLSRSLASPSGFSVHCTTV